VTNLWASALGFVAHRSEFTPELHIVEITKEDMTNLWKNSSKIEGISSEVQNALVSSSNERIDASRFSNSF
jgi:hypothetical protein